ncbi:hypothetical protein N9059_00665 [bacterium]|nr:hypothetical protein [bacterium]
MPCRLVSLLGFVVGLPSSLKTAFAGSGLMGDLKVMTEFWVTPVANLWLTKVRAMGVKKHIFVDSTGELSQILA